MFPPSFIRHLIRTTRLLLIGTSAAAIVSALGVIAMLFALTQKATWEFVVIALLFLVLADVARCKAIQHHRHLRLWKLYLRDYSRHQPAPQNNPVFNP
jgi:hypothetical protein